eukprot:gene12478-3161_t
MHVLFLLAIAIGIASAQKAHNTCQRKYKKVNCYNENFAFVHLFSDRSLSAHGNKGHLIDWDHWETYIHSLACRCNDEALKNGYEYFTLRFYGLCLGATRSASSASSIQTDCLGPGYQPCVNEASTECVGVSGSDYLYETGRDGNYTSWKESSCSKTCGVGVITKERTCTNPSPSGYGNDCSTLGPNKETVSCNIKPCSVDGGWSAWSDFTSCSHSCGGGNKTRTRSCDNPAPVGGGKECEGAPVDTRSCNPELCPGPAGVAKAQEMVKNFLTNFFNTTFPTKTPSGKFHKAVFEIQKVVANEFATGTTNENLEQRLKDLEAFLKVATRGGSIDFARATLAKGLFVVMQKKIEEGLPYDQITIATSDFLNSVKKQIGDTKFAELMLLNDDASLIFAFDTTGSMKDEIQAAKGIANAVIQMVRKFPVDYILSPFNDPEFGPVTYKNDSNKAEFLTAISSLVVRGGRDCPEMAFSGMLSAFDKDPKLGSPMFVFTDASAKDDTPENMNKLKTFVDQYATPISFFTNQFGCGDAKGINSYKEIASYSSGQIFPLNSHSEISSLTNYVKTSLRSGVIIAKGAFTPTYGRKRRSTNEHVFHVESHIDTLLVSLDVLVPNSARHAKLRDPRGVLHSAESTTLFTRVFNIDKPVPGPWSLSIPLHAGSHEFTAKLFSDKAIDFDVYYLHQEKDTWPVVAVSNPLAAPKSSMVLQVSGLDQVNRDSLRVSIVNEEGKTIKGNIGLSSIVGTMSGLLAKFDTPEGKFKVLFSGITNDGENFQRLSRVSYEKTVAALLLLKAGKDGTTSASHRSSSIDVYVYNQGSSQQYSFSAKANKGNVTPNAGNHFLQQGKNSTVSFTYLPPAQAASMIGKLVTVTVIATGSVNNKQVQLEVPMLVVP